MTPRRIHAWIAVALFLLPAAGEAEQIREVEVTAGAYSARALCTEGPRRAVLLPGDTDGPEAWRPVLERLSGRVGACAYDPGSGVRGSEAGSERGWFELLDELRSIHVALRLEPGYTIVGYGVGGLYARLYAVDRPGDVGALVLVDPAHEDMPQESRAGMPSEAWSRWLAERESPNDEGLRVEELARRVRGTSLPDIPVTVITATERRDGDGFEGRFLAEAARKVHASILRGVRSGRHVPAAGSGSRVHLESPDLVAEEIARVVRMTTGGKR